jgi:2-polyprenyl-3-methyl-5-hydroxy-6-metoxy-1,4-benzoquinol methylase
VEHLRSVNLAKDFISCGEAVREINVVALPSVSLGAVGGQMEAISDTRHSEPYFEACIFCGPDAASELLIRENGFDGRQCRACGLIFVSPRPRMDDVIDLYGHDGAHVSARSHLAAGFSKRLYARHTLDLLKDYATSGDLLDVGAGGGFFLDEARRRGFHPYAIEFNRAQIQYIRDALNIPCAAAALSADPFGGRSFDVIYHCDVISHFHDPISEFRTFHQVLKENGLLVFETGNLGDIDHRFLPLFERFQYPDHLYFFSSANIVKILELTGFELVALHRYSVLADLWTSRIRRRARRIARKLISGGREEPRQSNDQTKLTQAPPSVRRSIFDLTKSADQYLNFLIRYRLGRVLPKGRRPQTMIVIARKSGAC